MYKVSIVHGNDDVVVEHFENYENAVEWAEDHETERHGQKFYLLRLGAKFHQVAPDRMSQWGTGNHYVIIENVEGEP